MPGVLRSREQVSTGSSGFLKLVLVQGSGFPKLAGYAEGANRVAVRYVADS